MGTTTFLRIVGTCLLVGLLVGVVCSCLVQTADQELRLRAVEAAVAAKTEAK